MTEPFDPAHADELRRRLDAPHPEGWRPEREGDEIIGVFRRPDVGYAREKPCGLIVLETADGERSVWLWHAVLRSQIGRLRPRPGELVGIRWLGKRANAAGDQYDDYAVAIRRDDAPIDWSVVLDPGSEPAPPLDARAAWEAAQQVPCPGCGRVGGVHADGCPEDIPF